jgi:hypothetical protein
MTLKRALQAWFVLVLAALLWATTRASLEKDVLRAYADLGGDKWGLATLLDAYFGFAAFYAWVAYKEPRWASRLGWFVALMALGNFAIAAYALIELAHWDPATGPGGLLLRRKRAYEPEPWGDEDGGRRRRRKKRRRGRGGQGGGAEAVEAQRFNDGGSQSARQAVTAPAPRPEAQRAAIAPERAPKPSAPAQAQAPAQPKQGGGQGGRRGRKGGGSNSRNPFFVDEELPRRPERRQRTREERPSFGRGRAGAAAQDRPAPGERG